MKNKYFFFFLALVIAFAGIPSASNRCAGITACDCQRVSQAAFNWPSFVAQEKGFFRGQKEFK